MIYDTGGSPFKKFENYNFNLDIWLEYWYPLICNYLSIKEKDDYKALNSILNLVKSNETPDTLKELLNNEEVYIVAPGLNLESYGNIVQKIDAQEKIIVSVDGATSYLIENNIIPDIIVSDFDGNIKHQLLALHKGSTLVLHIHGDNFKVIKEHISGFSKYPFLFTTQTKPLLGSFNFLGFTDGDRAVCLSHYMNAKKINLLGFDFGDKIGYYSKNLPLTTLQKERKLKKFVIAKSIINWCAFNHANINIILI